MNKTYYPPKNYVLIRALYSLLLIVCLPLLLLLLRRKLRTPSRFRATHKRLFRERFGLMSNHIPSNSILVHCASVGEVNAAQQFIKDLQKQNPDIPMLLCTSSTTGAVHAFNLFKDSVFHHYMPFDLPVVMSRFFSHLNPRLVCIVEVEIWPNMLAQCRKRNIPVCLINARLSSDSLPTYRRLSWLMRPALRHFTYICPQGKESYDNFLSFGVYKPRLRLTQNMKFDLALDVEDEEKSRELEQQHSLEGQRVLVAASTHDNEESFIIEVFAHLRETHPGLRLIVVPRHPHRFEEVYLILKATGYSVMRASSIMSDPVASDIVLMDKMGWLKACYALADLAFIGGSIAPKGGHNALECALYGKPMVMGPSTFNNPNITRLLSEQGALKIIEGPKSCAAELAKWLDAPEVAENDGNKGKEVLQANSGAVTRTMKIIQTVLENSEAQGKKYEQE